jgi:hypothetical protein
MILHNPHLDDHSLKHIPRIRIILVVLAIPFLIFIFVKRITLLIMLVVRVCIVTVPVRSAAPSPHTRRPSFPFSRVILYPAAVSSADAF